MGRALTKEMLEEAASRLLETGFQPNIIFISPNILKQLKEHEQREQSWKKLGPLGYKMAKLKWELKHKKRDKKVLPLPE